MTQTLAKPYLPTTLRVDKHISSLSGMCAPCSDQCTGLCEIGLSAIRGPETTYPYDTTTHQFAAEKMMLGWSAMLMALSLILLYLKKW